MEDHLGEFRAVLDGDLPSVVEPEGGLDLFSPIIVLVVLLVLEEIEVEDLVGEVHLSFLGLNLFEGVDSLSLPREYPLFATLFDNIFRCYFSNNFLQVLLDLLNG